MASEGLRQRLPSRSGEDTAEADELSETRQRLRELLDREGMRPQQHGQLPGVLSIFSRFDLFVFATLFVFLWLFVKAEHNVDLADMLWQRIQPNYDMPDGV